MDVDDFSLPPGNAQRAKQPTKIAIEYDTDTIERMVENSKGTRTMAHPPWMDFGLVGVTRLGGGPLADGFITMAGNLVSFLRMRICVLLRV